MRTHGNEEHKVFSLIIDICNPSIPLNATGATRCLCTVEWCILSIQSVSASRSTIFTELSYFGSDPPVPAFHATLHYVNQLQHRFYVLWNSIGNLARRTSCVSVILLYHRHAFDRVYNSNMKFLITTIIVSLIGCTYGQRENIPVKQFGVLTLDTHPQGLQLMRRAEYTNICCSDCGQYTDDARRTCYTQCNRTCGGSPFNSLCCPECPQLLESQRIECYDQCQHTCRVFSTTCCKDCQALAGSERARCYQQCTRTCSAP